tara:strand:- start:243 stop:689 length:447 start_codon:yes stop_codon:yes gene_type:complete
MANVNIKFNGKEYLLSCENGQEEHLEELSIHLNEKFNNLKNSLGNIGENKLLLITAVTVMDEYFETKKKIDMQKNEIKNLTEKFKELKSLVYDYKEIKEKEISDLSENQLSLKNDLEKHKINYESLVDKATAEIENFIKRHEIDTQVQ